MIEDEGDPAAPMAHAQEVCNRFLAGLHDRTMHAYTADLDDFAQFMDAPPAAAVARLMMGGESAAWGIVLEYVVDLRRRHRAQSTIERRLGTLRAVLRTAYDLGFVEWLLHAPSEDEISAALEQLPARDSKHYLFPRHPSEVDRLDIQHYALRGTLGANYLAPLEEPQRILDVGCGTGQWGFEMCRQFASALVVGLDLLTGKAEQPAHYRFVRGNVLQGLPFADDQFDFVHQRLLVSGVPVSSWPALVGDLARVTRPGGWVELVEVPFGFERPGPAAERLMGLVRELSATLGLDATGVVYGSLHEYLRGAGLVNVTRHHVSVPIGQWGGEIGSLAATDSRAAGARVCEVLQARGRLSAEDAQSLLREAQEEWDHGHMSYPFAVAFARKPR